MLRAVKTPKKSFYQLAERKGAQEFHHNFTHDEVLKWVMSLSEIEGTLFTTEADYQFHKGGTFSKNSPTLKADEISHDRKKNHLIDSNSPPLYYKALGITRDKELQIEKFLREVDASLSILADKKEIIVADFGCGKAYLTFALYDFLSKKFKVKMTGIDLKKEVMEECQLLAQKLNFEGLIFQTGRIEELKEENLDMVVALHACDTATDAALAQAVCKSATLILAAPCCQHELYTQIKSPLLHPLLKHGILKERFASLVTDAIRGELLESRGYEVKIVEFIDAAHTPKNILIRATKIEKAKLTNSENYSHLKKELSIVPSLELFLNQYNI